MLQTGFSNKALYKICKPSVSIETANIGNLQNY